MDFGSNFLAGEIILMETKMRQKNLERAAMILASTPKKKNRKFLGLVSMFTGIGTSKK